MLFGKEVLSREDLDGVIDRQRSPDRVSTRAHFSPQHPLLERDAVCAPAYAWIALNPEDTTAPVDDDHHVLGIHREAAETVS